MLPQFLILKQRSHPNRASKRVSMLREDFVIHVLSDPVEGFAGDVVVVDLLNNQDFV